MTHQDPSQRLSTLSAPPTPRTIPRLVRWAAEAYGGAAALVDEAASGSEIVLSFADLAARVEEAAAAYLAAGIVGGDRVAIWAPNIWEWVVAALGAHAAGAALVPLNTRFKGTEAAYILRRSGARLLVTVEGFLGNSYLSLLRDAAGGSATHRPVADLPDLERVVLLRGSEVPGTEAWHTFVAGGAAVARDEVEARALAVAPEDLSDLLFTSGTTGHPKGVMTTHAQNLRAFAAWSEVVGLRPGDRYLIVNPFFHAFGYKAGILASLLRGATMLPHRVFDAGQVLERVERDRVSMLPGPPALYQAILAHPELATRDRSSLRLAVTGAAVIPVELVERMRDTLGFATVITGYGLTEACGIATMCRFDDDPETIATTSGRAIPDVEVRVAGPDGAELPRGSAGELLVRGYVVMRGYLDDPEQTAEAIDADGWLHTGDVGVMDERGYVRITDRLKDMYIMGGFNCYPAEIETLLGGCPGVREVAVVGVPDARMGEVGAAFVVAATDPAPSEAAVIAWAREHMANYKVPRYVRLVDALPRNALGKVQRFVLRDRLRDALGAAAAPSPAPSGETQP
jgi:acyl-CoA synthetase (AMP-forming)/AMP-acid ligase II